MLCSACGKQVDDRSAFCSSCGVRAGRLAPRSKAKTVIIAVGIVAVFGILCIGIAFAFAEPKLAVARMHALEMAAILNIRSINNAQVQYYTQFGRYARSLSELAHSSADLLPADLATGTKGGYAFTLHSNPTGYTLNANPVKYGSTGRRTFFSDESMGIRANSGPQSATAASKELYQP